MQLDEVTRKAIEAARHKLGAGEVILFGSRARNEARPDSDVDLCFLFPSFSDDPLELMYQLRRSIHETSDEALDILVYEQAVFERKASQSHTFEHLIRTEGVAV
jgi:predicted nucleotidyltransferase